MARAAAGVGEAEAEDDVIEPGLQKLEERFAGDILGVDSELEFAPAAADLGALVF